MALQIPLVVPSASGFSDPIVTHIAAEDPVKWYKKPNLRTMYICLFACCMGVEMTSGFDSQLINVLQFSGPWNKCILTIFSTISA
jgi:hypothetical protein